MTKFANHTAAAIAAILIVFASWTPAITVPPAQAAVAIPAPVLA